jgi:hypothetical protein
MVPVFGAAMNERRKLQRSRSLKGGKILFNNKQSVITCTVRNLSTEGANLQVQTAVGVPAFFDLLLEGDNTTRPCDVIWKAQNRIGVSFRGSPSQPSPAVDLPQMLPAAATATTATTSLRSDILSLRTALDEVPLGIARTQICEHSSSTVPSSHVALARRHGGQQASLCDIAVSRARYARLRRPR